MRNATLRAWLLRQINIVALLAAIASSMQSARKPPLQANTSVSARSFGLVAFAFRVRTFLEHRIHQVLFPDAAGSNHGKASLHEKDHTAGNDYEPMFRV